MPVILILAVLAVLFLSQRAGAASGPGVGSPAGGAGLQSSQPRFAGGADYYSPATGSKCLANTATGGYDCSQYDPCAPPPSGPNSTNAQLAHISAVANRICPGHVTTPLGPPPPPPPPPTTYGAPPPPPPVTRFNGLYQSAQTVATFTPVETLHGVSHFN